MNRIKMEGEMDDKNEIVQSNGYALIKKIHIVVVTAVLIITNLSYILYREITTNRILDDHEKRLLTVEGQGKMSIETNMNLREYFKTLGYKWIEIPK